jgi:PKD repeat protein
LSTNSPTSWSWDFNPATVTYTGGTTSASQNPQVQFTAGGLYTVTLTSANASGSDAETKTDFIHAQNVTIDLDITVFLEGSYNGTNMSVDLINSPEFPLTQPYGISPWNYSGSESVGVVPNANIADWVLVELRDATDAPSANSATMMDRQAAFLLNNGKIVGMDGSSNLQFSNSLIHQLFVVIWHRNHLGVMSSTPVTESGGVFTYDFSSGSAQAYGNSDAHKQIGIGVWGMMGGDGNSDGTINNTDKNPIWEIQTGKQGYLGTDYNLDTQVDNNDKNDMWIPNESAGSQVPN